MAALVGIISGIVAVITGVVTAIISFITSFIGSIITVISGIISSLSNIVSNIVNWLTPFFNNITSIIGKIITYVSNTVGSAIRFVWRLLGNTFVSQIADLLRLIINPLVELIRTIFSPIHALLTPIYETMSVLKTVIGQILNPIRDLISPIMDVIRFLYKEIALPIAEIIGLIRDVYSYIRVQVIAVIANEIRDFANLLSTLHILALTYRDIKDGKVFEALYRLMLYIDEDFAGRLREEMEGLRSEYQYLYNDLNKLLGIVQDDIINLQEYSNNLGKILQDIGKAFGIKSVEDWGKSLEEFSEGWLGDINSAIDKIRGWSRKSFGILFSPIINAYETMYNITMEWNRYKRIYETLTLRSLVEREMPKFTIDRIIVPRIRW